MKNVLEVKGAKSERQKTDKTEAEGRLFAMLEICVLRKGRNEKAVVSHRQSATFNIRVHFRTRLSRVADPITRAP